MDEQKFSESINTFSENSAQFQSTYVIRLSQEFEEK